MRRVISSVKVLAAAALTAALTACAAPPGVPGPGHVRGHVTVSPCTPVERFPPSPCPPAAGIKIAFGSSIVVATDATGNYAVTLPPGDYQVVVNAGIVHPVRRVRVESGDNLTLDFAVDSGIR